MNFSPEFDTTHMRVALEQATLSLSEGNMPIGAAIVHEGEIVSVGRNAIDIPPNDTLHAELVAIQAIAPFLAAHKRQCTIYTTLEPCMMCLGAIINVGIERVVVAASDGAVGALKLLPHADYYRNKFSRLQLVTGMLEAESQALLDEYVRRTGFRRHLSSNAG
jgi:tRNA(adenine34) deaminase